MGSLTERLAARRIYLDTPVFIYRLNKKAACHELAWQALSLVEKGGAEAVSSSLLFVELLVPYWTHGKSAQADRLRQYLLDFPNLAIRDLNADIALMAARLRARYGLKTPDAVHAATALANSADTILTNDKHFVRLRQTGTIDVILMQDFL